MLSEVVVRYSLIALVAGLIAFVATPITLMTARRMRIMDRPGPHKFHLSPVPVLGGLAIWAAIIFSLLIFGRGKEFHELAAIVIAGTLITIVGLIDDRINLGPRGKIIGQIIAMLIISLGGVRVDLFTVGWMNIVITIAWGVFVINAINLQDNMDGLAAGISAVSALIFLMLAVINGQVLVASLAASLLGACLGFLFYNYQPAVSFMGDTGSMLLGISLAILGIKLTFPEITAAQTWIVPILVLGVPFFDTVLVVVSRIRRGQPWWQGGIDHTSHRLVKLGLSHRRTVTALYVASGIFGLIAAVVVFVASLQVSLILVIAMLVLGIILIYAFELIWDTVSDNNLNADIQVAAIGGGKEFVGTLEAIALLARSVSIIVTPVIDSDNKSDKNLREIDMSLLQDYVVAIANHPGSVKRIMKSYGSQFSAGLREFAGLINSALKIRGELLVNLAGSVMENKSSSASSEVLNHLRDTQLIIIGGNVIENVIPTLLLPEVNRVLTRVKCPRVLIHSNPQEALDMLDNFGVANMITHAIATDDIQGPWIVVNDVQDSKKMAKVLYKIWLNSNNLNSLNDPLGVGSNV
mgnify:FL=1|tara:strand:+ start:651 stop:2390 length:1740 start_codon:yes stop_codon:yes gene_type:complete